MRFFFMKSVETGHIFACSLPSLSEKALSAFSTFACDRRAFTLSGLVSRIPFSDIYSFSGPDLTEGRKRHFLLLRRSIPATPA